jgi:nucleotide-binding universal stress UspA family protein
MKTIIVPTDFSNTADNALNYAVKLAELKSASIILLHAYHPLTYREDVTADDLNEKQLEEINRQVFQKLEQRIKTNEPTIKIELYLQSGLDVDVIVKVAEEKKADLVVLGISETGILEETFFGNKTIDTIRNSKIPLLIIPAGAMFKLPTRIVFASDYSELKNDQPLSTLLNFANSFKAKLNIVNVRKKREKGSSRKAAAVINVKKLLKKVSHTVHYPVNESVVDGINDFVKANGAEIVAMIPHKHNIFYRMFYISCTLKMAFRSEVPLLVLPEGPVIPVLVNKGYGRTVKKESVFLSEKISEEEAELFNQVSGANRPYA